MKREYINTIKGIEADLAKGKRAVKDIAEDCAWFADLADKARDIYPAVVFAFMAKCKTRKQFKEVIEAIEW